MREATLSLPQYDLKRGAQFKKAQDKLYLYFYVNYVPILEIIYNGQSGRSNSEAHSSAVKMKSCQIPFSEIYYFPF